MPHSRKKKVQKTHIHGQRNHLGRDSKWNIEETLKLVADPVSGYLLKQLSELDSSEHVLTAYLHAQSSYITALENIVLSFAKVPGNS